MIRTPSPCLVSLLIGACENAVRISVTTDAFEAIEADENFAGNAGTKLQEISNGFNEICWAQDLIPGLCQPFSQEIPSIPDWREVPPLGSRQPLPPANSTCRGVDLLELRPICARREVHDELTERRATCKPGDLFLLEMNSLNVACQPRSARAGPWLQGANGP